MQNLVSLMKEAEKGDYLVRSEYNHYDEITSLAKSFNAMINSIRQRDQELTYSQAILKDNEQKIKYLAFQDPLTGLYNRTKLVEIAGKYISRAINDKTMGAVIFIDLDDFKRINDTAGHTVGDEVLVAVGHRLNMFSPSSAIISRIGGDEFIILLRDMASIKNLNEILENILKAFGNFTLIGINSYNLTASVGAVIFPMHGTEIEDLLKKADISMYKAKAMGKNRYQIFDESILQELLQKVQLESDLRQAIANNDLELYYQPQYSADSTLHGFEALLRWNSPNGPVSPTVAVAIAEETGLIIALEQWVLRNACQFAIRINAHSSTAVKISINIKHENFARNIKNILYETQVNPRHIGLEITETVLMEFFGANQQKLTKLKQLGFEVYLDDFGSG